MEEQCNISKSFISENRKSEERFFDDISNEDLIGLDVVDSWEEANSDNDDLNKLRQRSKTPSDYEKRHSPLLQCSSTERSSQHRYDRKFSFALKRTAGQYNRPYKTRYNNQPRKYFDKKEILETRRDPSKTKRDIQRDKDRCAKDLEAKVVEKKIKVAESGLCPPGMEDNMIENLNEFNVASKQDVFLKVTEKISISDHLEKQISPLRKSPVKSSSRRRSPIYNRYRSSERFKDFRRIDSRSNVSRYSPDRYQPERHKYKSEYRPLGKRMSRSPSLTVSSGSDVSVRETWLINRQSKMRRSKSPIRGRRKPFIEEIKHQLEEKSLERKQFRETSQMINQLPPQPNIYPLEYQHFPPMQYDPSIMPPMCPNPYEPIPHPNMNIPYPDVNIPHSANAEMNMSNSNIGMSYSETHVPPREMNILPLNMRVLDVPNVSIQNPNSMQYLPNPGSNPQNPIFSLPNSDMHSSNSVKFSNISPPMIRRTSPEQTRQLIDTSTYMTARPKSNEEKNTISKLFQDKKINLSDFLAATATEDSSSFNIQEKIKVISRCQDAIKNLSSDLNKPTRFIPTSLYSDVLNLKKNQNHKWLSPLEKIQTISVPFTENSDRKTLIRDRLQKLLVTLQLPTLAVRNSRSSSPTPPTPQPTATKSNQSAKFVQTDSYKCQMCEFHKENKKSQSIQTENSLTYDIGVQVNMEDIVVDYQNQGRIKSILKNAPPPPSISHMTAAQLLQMSEPEKNNEQPPVSDFGLQAQFDAFKSRSLNIPYTGFPNNQPNPSLCSYGNSSNIDLQLANYSLGGNNLPSTLNYDTNNPSNSANYSSNNLNSPSSSGNFNSNNFLSSGNFNPINPSISGKFNSNNPSSSGNFNRNNTPNSRNFNKNNPSGSRNFNKNNSNNPSNSANFNKNNTRGKNLFRNKSGGWGPYRGNSNKNKKKFSI